MKLLKTENCIVCGKKAMCWHGYVVAKEQMALGNHVDRRVIAGFCDEHAETEVRGAGSYGEYSSSLMGKCIPLFN